MTTPTGSEPAAPPRRPKLAIRWAVLLVAAGLATVAGAVVGASRTSPPPKPIVQVRGSLQDRHLKVTAHIPKGWKVKRDKRLDRIISPDRTTAVVISSPGPASLADQVVSDETAAIQAEYKHTKVTKGGLALGGRPSKSVTITAVNAHHTPLTIRLISVKGKKRAYLIEVFSAANPPGKRLVEAQVILTSLKFKG